MHFQIADPGPTKSDLVERNIIIIRDGPIPVSVSELIPAIIGIIGIGNLA